VCLDTADVVRDAPTILRKKIEELMNVRGVGEKNFLKLKDQISVGTAKADHDQPPPR
jgi:hypothetical protein